MSKFEKNLADGIEFEDFIDYSGLIFDLFKRSSYIDCRNHTLDEANHKGPRLKIPNNVDYELPDFQIYQNNKMSWLEVKSKPSGAFKYSRFGGSYFSLDRSKFLSYQRVFEYTQAEELYFLFGDMKTNLIYFYRQDDFRDWADLKTTGFSPLFPAIKEFLVAEIIDYENNKYRRIS